MLMSLLFLYDYIELILFYFLFVTLYGLIILVNRSIIVILMIFEMLLLLISLNFSFLSIMLDDFAGNIFSLCILGVAAGESVIGLALLIVFYRAHSLISLNILNTLKY